MTGEPKTCLTDGGEVTGDHRDIKDNGQQKGYVVLCPEERAKGYVRPLRKEYFHGGNGPKHPLRDLTDYEKDRFLKYDYVKYEAYPDGENVSGRFWTQRQLDSGCRTHTTICESIAETYARNPKFYGSTFCVHCGEHFPVEEFVWAGTSELVGS